MYHPMMIRYLNSADFAIFQSLMSMFNIFGVVSAGVSMYLVQQFSIYSENTQKLLMLKQYRSSFAKRRG
jgi:O-antigen/teichoic acid export membrane protein